MLSVTRTRTTYWAGRLAARALRLRQPTLDGVRLVDHWSLGGVGPRTVEFLAAQITARRPRRILECGPGTSTIAMARAVETLGLDTTIVSLEHDASWGVIMRRRVERCGLAHRVEILVGAMHRSNGSPFEWYGRAAEARARGPYDFVVIDGPPSRDGMARRSPALPMMWDVIADGAMIVLDDGRRAGERECARRWQEQFGERLSGALSPIEKGLWVFEKSMSASTAVEVVVAPWVKVGGAAAPARG